MANSDDASIKLLYAADAGTRHTADTVQVDKAFDLVADIEIGENLNERVDDLDLFVGVRNLTQSRSVTAVSHHEKLTPVDDKEERREVRVKITPPPKTSKEGDVLQCVATLKVTHGVNTDYSHASSETFVVVP